MNTFKFDTNVLCKQPSLTNFEDHESESLKIAKDQDLSVMEGGSCPSSPQVKKACRLVVLGSTQTGKTCVLNRFLKGTFDDCYMPTIENFHRKLYRIHGEFYQLDILEVGGNDPFPASRRLSLITGDLFLIIFGIDNVTSYEEALRIRNQILELKEEGSHENGGSPQIITSPGQSSGSSFKKSSKQKRVPIVIVANKNDLPTNKHAVDLEAVRMKLMSFENCAFCECSAKTNENIDEVFFKLFHLAKLPKQMSPGMHRHAGFEKSLDPQALRKQSPVIRLRSKHSEPAMVFDADCKRPSLRTDLLMLKVKKSQQTFVTPAEHLEFAAIGNHRHSRKHKRCVIM